MSDELKILQVMGPGLTIHIHCLHVNLKGLLVLRTVPYGQSFLTPVVKIQIKVYRGVYYSKRYVNVKSDTSVSCRKINQTLYFTKKHVSSRNAKT